ncbi:MAG: flagellar type III secretion system pore protein FliP [Acidimicrobiia bacterium]
MPTIASIARRAVVVACLAIATFAMFAGTASRAGAQVTPNIPAPNIPAPNIPTPNIPTPSPGQATNDSNNATISIDVGKANGSKGASQPVMIILMLTVVSVAPSLLILMTSFTRIVVVLSITRNAIGMPTIPPTQVLVGLSLFLTIFSMMPTLRAVNDTAIQPLMNNKIDQKQAIERAQVPLKKFMLTQTRRDELTFFVNASKESNDGNPEKTSLLTIIPAFIISELKTAFIIGFVILVPFLVIDMIVSSSLMSMGMFMLPPMLVALPFKLLLFIMVDGWQLVIENLLKSFR